jgi:predicted transposase/invertase (TIGR01784 family)
MAIGIDPKNDYAFKRVFGNVDHLPVLIHLLNAVLKPPAGKKVAKVSILNPITLPTTLDEKQLILDILALDETGRRFNIEMQMLLHPAFVERLLLYWSKTYSGQLVEGNRYSLLRPVITICFLDDILFSQVTAFHHWFRLWDPDTRLTLSDHFQVHFCISSIMARIWTRKSYRRNCKNPKSRKPWRS